MHHAHTRPLRLHRLCRTESHHSTTAATEYHPFSPLYASTSEPGVAATTRATFYHAHSSAIPPRPLLDAHEENRTRYHLPRHEYQLQRISNATDIDMSHDIESAATSTPNARDNICCTVTAVLHVVLGYARVSDSLLSRTRYHTTHGTVLVTPDGASSAFIVLARDYARHISRADIVDRARRHAHHECATNVPSVEHTTSLRVKLTVAF